MRLRIFDGSNLRVELILRYRIEQRDVLNAVRDQVDQRGMPRRMHGITTIRTLRDGYAVDELNAPYGGTPGFGKRRCKDQCFAAARRKACLELLRYVAA